MLDDVPDIFRRKWLGNDTDFNPEFWALLDVYPECYRKNYHHQTDGYMSLESAKRSDLKYELVLLAMGQSVRESAASIECAPAKHTSNLGGPANTPSAATISSIKTWITSGAKR
jgi:hypothetical protein